jgi:hypothetical protein
MGLGSLKAVSLASAREKVTFCRASLADGIDPIEARKTVHGREPTAEHKTITFEDAANAYMAAHEAGWKNAKHASQWRNTLAAHAYPVAGRLLVTSILGAAEDGFVFRSKKHPPPLQEADHAPV